MATTSVGQPFGIVTSKDQDSAIKDSKTNAGQFYITKTNSSNTGAAGNTEGNGSDAMALTMNGNVLRGVSKTQAINIDKIPTIESKLNNISTGGSSSGSLTADDTTSKNIVQNWIFKDSTAITLSSPTYNIETKTLSISTNPSNNVGIPNQVDIKLSTGLSGDNGKLYVDLLSLTGVNLQSNNDKFILDVNKLSGTTKDKNNYFYSKGGIYFAETIASNQQDPNHQSITNFDSNAKYMRLRCGTGFAFKEGTAKTSGTGALGENGCYYVHIDNTTIRKNATYNYLEIGLSSKYLESDGINLIPKLAKIGSSISEEDLQQKTLPCIILGTNEKDEVIGLGLDTTVLTAFIKKVMEVK